MKKKVVIFLKIIFSLGMLYYVFKDIDLQQLISGIKEVNIPLLLFAFSLFYIATFLSGCKNSYILSGNFKQSLYISKLNLSTVFLNNFIPGSITSDIYKGYKLKKYYPGGKVLFGILTDRISGMLILLVFFSISGIFFLDFLKKNLNLNFSHIYILGIVAILVVLIVIIFRKKIGGFKIIQDFTQSCKGLSFRKTVTIFVFTICIRILTPIMFFMELVSINPDFINIPFYYIVFITTTTELINILPITIKGYGVREFIWLSLLSPFGLSVEVIATLSILIIINDLIASFIGFYLFQKFDS